MICATCRAEIDKPFAVEPGTEGEITTALGLPTFITFGTPDRAWCSLACWPWAPRHIPSRGRRAADPQEPRHG